MSVWTDEEFLNYAQTQPRLSPDERKRVVDILVSLAEKDKPQIDHISIRVWVQSKMPYWSRGKVEDYGYSVYTAIIRLLKERKEAKHTDQPKAQAS